MTAMRAEKRQVVRCWYPESRGELFDLGRDINAQVLIGDPAYQVTDGEIVSL